MSTIATTTSVARPRARARKPSAAPNPPPSPGPSRSLSADTLVSLGGEAPGTSSASGTTAPSTLAQLGVYGFERHEAAIFAALVTEDPLLLVGRSGTGKTFLLNTLSEALGLEHRHYNASLISFDDLVGFPYPDEARESVRFLETPATVWGAESVLIDEISRCKPEHQNRLFSLVHERRLQGLALERLRYRWAAMNPVTTDQSGVSGEDYAGSEPLDPALADRFALIVPAADWQELTEDQRKAIVAPAGEGSVTPVHAQLRAAVARWRARFLERIGDCPPEVVSYVTTVVSALNGADVRVSPRRARLLARSLVAATIVAGRTSFALYRSVLECSVPHATWGRRLEPALVASAHQLAWDASQATAGAWVHRFLAEPKLDRKLALLLEQCLDRDEGSQAIAQFVAQERPDRAAAFAFATYPAALAGHLPIGAEGINDLARIAAPVIDAEGELSWQERLNESGTSHPTISQIGKVLAALEGTRHARARQFLTACLVRRIAVDDPAGLEAEIDGCVAPRPGGGMTTFTVTCRAALPTPRPHGWHANAGAPMSRRRTEKVLSSVLRDAGGPVHLPRVLRAGLKFMDGDDPVDRVLTALSRYGLDDAELLRERFAIPDRPMIARVVADAQWGVVATFAREDAVLREALLLGLCTAWQYDPARPVIWTRASLTRHVELHDPAGFYA